MTDQLAAPSGDDRRMLRLIWDDLTLRMREQLNVIAEHEGETGTLINGHTIRALRRRQLVTSYPYYLTDTGRQVYEVSQTEPETELSELETLRADLTAANARAEAAERKLTAIAELAATGYNGWNEIKLLEQIEAIAREEP